VVGPLELFYDLAVVVLVAQAARHLAGHLTWGGLGEFVVVFTLIWIAWANGHAPQCGRSCSPCRSHVSAGRQCRTRRTTRPVRSVFQDPCDS
jgi:hypothetical protein